MYGFIKHHIPSLFIGIFSFLLISQFGKHFFFPFSFLSGIRIDYLAPTLYFIDVLSLVFIFYSIIHISQLVKVIRKNILISLLALFLILVNYFFALSKPIWFYSAFRVIQWVSIFYFFKRETKKKELCAAAVIGFILGAVFEFILSLSQLSLRHSLQGWWYYLGEREFSVFTPGIAKAYFMGKEFLRPYGTFSHPNSLAGFYLLLYSFFLTQKRITNVVLKTIGLSLFSFLIIISFSRTAIVIYVLVNLLYFFRNSLSCKTCFLAKMGVGLFLLFFAFNITGDIYSLQKRTDFFQKSVEIIAKAPFSGVGMGSYLIAQHAYPQAFSLFFEQPVHNIFMLTIAQLGIPLSALIFFLIYKKWRLKLNNISFLLPLLCVVLTGSIDHYWMTLIQNWLLSAVIFGVLGARS